MNDEPRNEDRPRMPPMPPYPPRHVVGVVSADVVDRLEQELRRLPNGQDDRDSFQSPPEPDPLAELARLIEEPPRVPEIGVQAARGMEQLFDAVAKEMEAAAEDGVRRAESVRQDVLSYTSVLRQTGKLLSEEIESKAAMTGKLALGVRLLREAFPGVPAREPGT